MQMKKILHPGVIKTSVMCVVGVGVLKKPIAQHCSLPYTNVIIVRLRRRRGPGVVKQSLGWIADCWLGMGVCLLYSTGRWLHGGCTRLLIIWFTEHKAALIGFKFLLIGIYGELLSRKVWCEEEEGLWLSGLSRVTMHVEAFCQLLNGEINQTSQTHSRRDTAVLSKHPLVSIQGEKCPLGLIVVSPKSRFNGQLAIRDPN